MCTASLIPTHPMKLQPKILALAAAVAGLASSAFAAVET
jgi:hypothetical protein